MKKFALGFICGVLAIFVWALVDIATDPTLDEGVVR